MGRQSESILRKFYQSSESLVFLLASFWFGFLTLTTKEVTYLNCLTLVVSAYIQSRFMSKKNRGMALERPGWKTSEFYVFLSYFVFVLFVFWTSQPYQPAFVGCAYILGAGYKKSHQAKTVVMQ